MKTPIAVACIILGCLASASVGHRHGLESAEKRAKEAYAQGVKDGSNAAYRDILNILSAAQKGGKKP